MRKEGDFLNLYFHNNTEMARYYIEMLLRDGEEHSMSEIHDYVMENCKGHSIMGEPIRATVISSALWRLANTSGSGYCRLRRGVYQMGDPEKTMKETPSFYERAIRIVSRAERELAGSFYGNLDQRMDLKTSMEAQKAGREVLDKLGKIKAELAAMQQEFVKEREYGQDQTSGMSMEL